jgi:hypothetical protein
LTAGSIFSPAGATLTGGALPWFLVIQGRLKGALDGLGSVLSYGLLRVAVSACTASISLWMVPLSRKTSCRVSMQTLCSV